MLSKLSSDDLGRLRQEFRVEGVRVDSLGEEEDCWDILNIRKRPNNTVAIP